jgi:hypothetical protein
LNETDLERVLEIAHELDQAGRARDAALLARLAGQHSARFVPDLPDDELDRRLEEADEDIAAGRVTPEAVVWAQLEAARAAPVIRR